jgi:intracellular septation protein
MKFLFDLFPVILFVSTYMITESIYTATAVIIPATIAQVVYARVKHGKVDKMLWASLVLIVVMGGLTLVLQDKRFILWKPTVLYWLFAVILALTPLVSGTNIIKAILGKELTAPDRVWARLNLAWIAFFAVLGGVNLYVAYNFSEKFWVQFKLWGGIGFMLVFILAQALVLSRFVEEKDERRGENP